MELIDKVKIPYKLVSIDCDYSMKNVVVAFAEDIEEQPIIEVIPINWIHQYLNRQDEIHNLPVQVELFMMDMIDKWKKENVED